MSSSSASLRLRGSSWLALDIGGANLKAADGRGFAVSRPFPLWQKPNELSAAIEQLIAESPPCERIAMTMTGELADCFRTKAEGVRFIVDAVATAAGNRPMFVYLTNGRLVPPEVAVNLELLAAASNWHALAQFACRYLLGEPGLLVDLGSTTTDIIPLVDDKPAASGRTDTQRLLAGELVYTGVERTPVCAIADSIPYRGRLCPVARELFATMWDVYLSLDKLSEEPESTNTADGRPATKAAAVDRLARMICADSDSFQVEDAVAAARYLSEMQRRQIETALDEVLARMTSPPKTVVLSGQGEFLLGQILDERKMTARRVVLTEELGPVLSRCAPAHGLAVIAAEEG
jgi:(4-(4-[2-(gamma-L-glutamylamino)ethyl]phenoxymethyl)furan-2-yl)methanamine synthase